MPRGQASTGTWNFHIRRYVCPSCKRKGLHFIRFGWVCMYKNCVGKKSHETYFRKIHDEEVLKLNPTIKR